MLITHLFSQEYGDIEYCIIVKNKTTGESKGLGYVRYHKPSQAATAIENCEKSKLSLFIHITCLKTQTINLVIHVCFLFTTAYRAILAEPRNKTPAPDNDYFSPARAEHVQGDPGMTSYPFGMYLPLV